jgi:hypothetical protein
MTTPNPTAVTAPLSTEREAKYRERAAAEKPGHFAIRELLAELDRVRAEYEPYERLTDQGCQAGKHPTWLIDSEYHHACPWCESERVRAERDRYHWAWHNARERAASERADVAFVETQRDTLKEQLLTAQGDVASEALRTNKAEAERDELKKRVAVLDGRLNDAAMTRVWTNENGKKFVFLEDIAPALLGLNQGLVR